MRNSPTRILLVGTSEESSNFILSVLRKLGFNVAFATNIEMSIQKALKELPDLIICFYDLNELSGFQVYNILDNEIFKHEIPFIMVFNQFRKNELFVAVELGIDSFIFPPYDLERISNIILKQLEKNAKRKAGDIIKFDSVCKVIPYGIFVADNKQVVETNETFEKLIEGTAKVNGRHTLREIFNFSNGNDDELKLSRFMNGLTQDCSFCDIKINGRNNDQFNLYFSLVNKRGSSSKVVGIVIPQKEVTSNLKSIDFLRNTKGDKKDFLDPDVITSRERQVLQLSAMGSPIKQIAERLGISERTVEKHRSNIIQKTKSENIMEAVFLYGKNHMLNMY